MLQTRQPHASIERVPFTVHPAPRTYIRLKIPRCPLNPPRAEALSFFFDVLQVPEADSQQMRVHLRLLLIFWEEKLAQACLRETPLSQCPLMTQSGRCAGRLNTRPAFRRPSGPWVGVRLI